MSGGYFDYKQYEIDRIADDIENYIYGVEWDEEDIQYAKHYIESHDESSKGMTDFEYKCYAYIAENGRTMPNKYGYSAETLEKFKEAVDILRKGAVFARRIDWLLSDDDGEKSFHERLESDLQKLSSKK